MFITEGLPQQMNAANYGDATTFRPDVLTMQWIYRRRGSRNNSEWELSSIYLTGPRIHENGEAGKQQMTNDYWPGGTPCPGSSRSLPRSTAPLAITRSR